MFLDSVNKWAQDREITDKLVSKHILTLETHKFQRTDDMHGNQTRTHKLKNKIKNNIIKIFYFISPEMEKNQWKKYRTTANFNFIKNLRTHNFRSW